MVLFLDLDGVLHYDAVYRDDQGAPSMRKEGHALFEWSAPILRLVAGFPELAVVLTSSWVPVFGYAKTLAYLPEPLPERVAGATWDGSVPPELWHRLTRYEQLQAYLGQRIVSDWVAIDDDASGWPPALARRRLVLTNPHRGLSDLRKQVELVRKLAPFLPMERTEH